MQNFILKYLQVSANSHITWRKVYTFPFDLFKWKKFFEIYLQLSFSVI